MVDETTEPLLFDAPVQVPVNVSVNGARVVASGFVLAKSSHKIDLEISDLRYEIVFDDTAKDQGARNENLGDKKLRIVLEKFNNSLGTSLSFVSIGSIMGEPLRLSLYVEAVGNDIKAVSYTVYLGGSLE